MSVTTCMNVVCSACHWNWEPKTLCTVKWFTEHHADSCGVCNMQGVLSLSAARIMRSLLLLRWQAAVNTFNWLAELHLIPANNIWYKHISLGSSILCICSSVNTSKSVDVAQTTTHVSTFDSVIYLAEEEGMGVDVIATCCSRMTTMACPLCCLQKSFVHMILETSGVMSLASLDSPPPLCLLKWLGRVASWVAGPTVYLQVRWVQCWWGSSCLQLPQFNV